MFERCASIVGPDVPVVATFDLHANVSDRMVELIDAFIGYRTNPHLDMRERGEEAAAVMRELLAGTKTERVRIRLPIVPPTVTMLTAAGPYAEMIELGQKRMGPEIINVSVMGGFAYADTAKNGLSVIVTARRRPRSGAAEKLAREIAQYGWEHRARFYPKLTPLEEAVEKALAVGARPGIAGAVLCRCRRQSGRRRARQHDVPVARLCRGRGQGRAVRRHLRPAARRRGAPARAPLQFHARSSTATRPRISPRNGARRRGWRR